MSTRGLGHRRILRDGEVTARAAGFVVEHLARCGCGRLASGTDHPAACPQCALERYLLDTPSRWPTA